MPKTEKILMGGNEIIKLITDELTRRGKPTGVIAEVTVNMIGPVSTPDKSGMIVYRSDRSKRITTFTLSVELKQS